MREVHDAADGGHFGREKTYHRLTAEVYWKGVYHDVRDYVRSCVSCAQNKAMNRASSDLLHPLPIPVRRWETVTMDFVGPLPLTAQATISCWSSSTSSARWSTSLPAARRHGVAGGTAGV